MTLKPREEVGMTVAPMEVLSRIIEMDLICWRTVVSSP